jgi:hypothetical protein
VQSRLALRKSYLGTPALATLDIGLGAPQQKHSAVTVRDRIHLARSKFLDSFLCLA